ncbi:hypothetical protein TRVL_07620 [Trypanosoma vivax]|nr:hypothetical protein TRVL_07620 [Trypanosoma vivax]
MRQLPQMSFASDRFSACIKIACEAVLGVFNEREAAAQRMCDQLRSAAKWTVEHKAALDAIEPISNCLWDAKTNNVAVEHQEALNELFEFVPGVNESEFLKKQEKRVAQQERLSGELHYTW